MTAICARFAASATSVKSFKNESVVDDLVPFGGGGAIWPLESSVDDELIVAAEAEAYCVEEFILKNVRLKMEMSEKAL